MATKKRVSRGETRKRKASPKASAHKGSVRAQSWIYAAINPLIDALESEVARLSQGHLSWRARERRLEFIRPPRRYLLETGQIILDDFGRSSPEEAHLLLKHERLVEELTRDAAAAHDALMNDPVFHSRAREFMEEFRRVGGRALWEGWSEVEYLSRLAEMVVNNGRIDDIRSFQEAAVFFAWMEPMALLEFRRGELFSRLQEAVDDCKADAVWLIEHLRSVRSQLCDEYDIPAAPFEGVTAFERL